MNTIKIWGVLAAIGFSSVNAFAGDRIVPEPPKLIETEVLKSCLSSKTRLQGCLEGKLMDQADYDFYAPILAKGNYRNRPGNIEICVESVSDLKRCLESEVYTVAEFLRNYPLVARVEWGSYWTKLGDLQSFNMTQPSRCDGDSLGQEAALGRNMWLQKCMPFASPSLKEAIQELIKNNGGGRPQYMTMMQAIRNEKGLVELKRLSDWRAPAPAVSAASMAIADANERFAVQQKEINAQLEKISCDIPQDWVVAQVCTAGCYTPDQVMEFIEGNFAIGSSKAFSAKKVRTLAKGASLDKLSYGAQTVQQIVESEAPTKQPILTFETKSGKKLSVTLNHPLVMFSGKIQRADTLKVGDVLVSKEGNAEPIAKITRREISTKVYNVQVNTEDKNANIVVAQGLLNGSVFYQNEGTQLLNRVLFRTKISTKAKKK